MKAFLLTAFMLTSTVSLFADIDTNLVEENSNLKTKEKLTIPMTDEETKKWAPADTQVLDDGSFVLEWVPANEGVENWSQLLQIQFFPEANKTKASDFVSKFLAALKDKFPKNQSKIISQNDDAAIFEWSIPEENGEPAQYEIAKVITRDNGIFRVAFTKKTNNISDDQKKEWLKFLTQAKIS